MSGLSPLASLALRHLGGEVPVEETLAVQVAESPGDVQRQAEAHAPRQVHVAAQQLLQVTAINVLEVGREKRKRRKLTPCFAKTLAVLSMLSQLCQWPLTSVRAWSCPSWTHTPINLGGGHRQVWFKKASMGGPVLR